MKNLVYFLQFQKKSKIFFIIFLLFAGTFLDLFGLSMIIPLINAVADYDKINNLMINYNILDPLSNFNQNQLIILLLAIFLIINVFKGLIFIYLNWKTNEFSKDLNINISSKLINYYSSINYEEMIAKSSGTLIRNITEEVMGVSNAISSFLSLVVEIFVVVFIFIFILFVEPNGLLIISFFLLLGLYLFKKITNKRLISWGKNRQKLFLKKISIINELFHSYPELKLLKKINYFGKLYINFNKEFFNNVIKFNIVQIIPRFLIESLAVLGMMFALIYLIIIENNQTQIIYSLAILGASALRLLPTISRIVNYYNSFKFSAASINLVKSEIQGRSYFEKKDIKRSNSLKFVNKISLNNISYTYPNKEIKILDNINLEIKKNEVIGIKGLTGSGKSTLLKIILGLLKPQEGNLMIDKVDIHKSNFLDFWYEKVAYVPQNIYLLNESIKKNILLGLEESDQIKENYNESVNISLCSEFIDKMKDNDQTIVGENGLKLSGGQKQRLGLARALYLKKEVLILDEATNSLDEFTEKKILEKILNLPNKPTIIFVSHKSANFEICDKIINISDLT
jgi:ATP-binding cassette subfamily C protein